MNVRARLQWAEWRRRGGGREGGREGRGFEGPLGEGRGVDPALIVWDFKGCPLRKEAEGVEGWCDRWLRGTGLASAWELTPISQLKLSHIASLCHVAAIVPGLSGNVSPLVQCFLCESPRRDSKTCPRFLIEAGLSSRERQKRNDFWIFGQGVTEESHWGEGGKKIRTHCIVAPWTAPSFYPCTQVQSLWPQSLARLFSIPNLFFLLFTSLSLTVLENPTFSSVGDQSSKPSALAVLWEVAFPGFGLIRRDTAFPFRWKKNAAVAAFFFSLVQEEEQVARFAPKPCSLAPVPSGFHINHESGRHTLVVWIECGDLFSWNEVLILARLGMEGGKKQSVFTLTTLAWREGQPRWAGEKGNGGKTRPVEYPGQGWSNGTNDECSGLVMIHQGEDDSFLVVPWSLFSPEQMTFIKGWTAGVGFPGLKSRSGNKTWERAKRFKGFTHLLLQYGCLGINLSGGSSTWVQLWGS